MDSEGTGATALRYRRLFAGDFSDRMNNVFRRSSSLRNALRDIQLRADLFGNAIRVSLEVIEPSSRRGKVTYRIDSLDDQRGRSELQDRLDRGRTIELFRGGTDWGSAIAISCEVDDAAERRLIGDQGLEKHEYRLRRIPVSKKPRDALFKLQNAPMESDVPLLNFFNPPTESDWPAVHHAAEGLDWCVLRDDDRDGCGPQREFVQLLLESPDFSLLNGPPGSGKTTVITEAVVQAVRRGRRILLCAPTHVAVDNVLERLSDTGLLEREGILAVRIESGKYTASQSMKPFLEDEIADTFRSSVRSFLETDAGRELTAAQRSLLEFVNADDSRLEDLLVKVSNLVCGTTLGVIDSHVFDDSEERDATNFFDHLIIDEASKVTLPEMLVPAIRSLRWSLIGDVRQLSPVGASDVESVLAGVMTREFDPERDPYAARLLEALAEGVRRSRSRESPGPSHGQSAELSEVSFDLWAEQLGWRLETLHGLRQLPAGDSDRSRLESEIQALCRSGDEEIDREIEAACQLVDGVCIGSVLEALQSGVGSRDASNRSVLSEGLPKFALDARSIDLTHQHRMHPEISRFPRQHFYGGDLLLDAAQVEGRQWSTGRYGSRSVWLNARSDGADESDLVVVKELEALINSSSRPSRVEAGILFFYANQVRSFRRLLRSKYTEIGAGDVFTLDGGRVSVRVGTVDSFQGREADIVFLVLGNKGETPFTKSPNRVNVALTRARHQLVIVGDHAVVGARWSGPLARLASEIAVDHFV